MRKVIISILFLSLISSCSKPSEPDNPTNVKDPSLIFSLAINNGVSDTSSYKSIVAFRDARPIYFKEGSVNLAEFATDRHEYPNTPAIEVKMPNEKFSNSITVFLEVKNSETSGSIDGYYAGDTDHYIRGGFSNYRDGFLRLSDDFSFASEKTSWDEIGGHNLYFPSASSDCINYNHYKGLIGKTFNLNTSNFSRIAIVLDNRVGNIYVNQESTLSLEINEPIILNRCKLNTEFTIQFGRGSILKKLKVYNRALTSSELAAL
ncbi:hypothetical protein [Flavihumibacter sp. ZG627]|uniref:hypothetical protein n=1 Tax=Flavihumibacter sp. ZG627 TaxID=1463156 RepID=UPI00057E0E67|nr:hypothetical protein [Flavihumibacter sp. ZG627]KIC90814.1 hypothetical protein HY58_07105 [Flavihumibacter sp. ZG627]